MPHTEFWPFNRVKNAEGPSVLQKQLGDMEGEVKEIQMELEAIRKDRFSSCIRKQANLSRENQGLANDVLQTNKSLDTNQKLNKYSELTMLREELSIAKNAVDDERYQREKYEQKLKEVENKLNNICGHGSGLKEASQLEEENSLLRSQVTDLKEEIEEIKLTAAENAEQLQEYRVRYMQSQQEVMEYKRQLDVADFDSKHVSDQVHLEIQKMKLQFQEKLQELSPLPDLLKGAQIQLQEAKQLQNLAEESSQQLSMELDRVKEKLIEAVNNLSHEKADKHNALELNQKLLTSNSEKQKEIDILNKEIDDYKCKLLRLEEKLNQQELRFSEKANLCSQVHKELEDLRVESSRTISRSKERADSMRRYLQAQVSDLERQLIQSRAQFKTCQKERDEIRQRMQLQVNSLQENFELSEIRLRNLQRKVASMSNSYSVILADDDDLSSTCKIVSH